MKKTLTAAFRRVAERDDGGGKSSRSVDPGQGSRRRRRLRFRLGPRVPGHSAVRGRLDRLTGTLAGEWMG